MLWADCVCSSPMTIRRLATGTFKRVLWGRGGKGIGINMTGCSVRGAKLEEW